MYCIYRITNLINGKTYIGQHKYKKTPYDDYMGSGTLLHRAYKKYGIDNFIKDIIIADIKDKETIDKLEIKYIEYERASNGNGCYNIADGGGGASGSWHRSEEYRIKMSAACKGKRHLFSEEHKSNMSAAKKGRKIKPHSKEHRAKLSAAMKGKQNAKGKHWKLVNGKRVYY